ncbi:hypothetical protein BC828DRAFT_376200 [Blastocladiella britannica]|nr:hypothetical protein BC828DRAFT_376200 [Blastocladiella britannica]
MAPPTSSTPQIPVISTRRASMSVKPSGPTVATAASLAHGMRSALPSMRFSGGPDSGSGPGNATRSLESNDDGGSSSDESDDHGSRSSTGQRHGPAPPGRGGNGNGGGGGTGPLAERLADLLMSPTVSMVDPSLNVKTEAALVDAEMAAVKAAIAKLEREIRDTFTTRRIVTSSSTYFPDVSVPPSSSSPPGAATSTNGGSSSASPSSSNPAGSMSMAGSASGGGLGVTGNATDDMILRAKAELLKHKDRVALGVEEKKRAQEADVRALDEKVHATRQRFAENAQLMAAGPKYVSHFISFFGHIMHVEILSSSIVVVFTSRGFIEVWRLTGTPPAWSLSDHWPISAYHPRITCVAPMFPSQYEQTHLIQNRMHYLRPPDDMQPANTAAGGDGEGEDGESVEEGENGAGDDSLQDSDNGKPAEVGDWLDTGKEEDKQEEAGDQAAIDLKPAVPTLVLRTPSEPPSTTASPLAAAVPNIFPGSSRRSPPPPPPADDLVGQLTSATYDLGGDVAVSDEQAVRRTNYYAFMVAWLTGRSVTVGPTSVERALFLVGCANGEASVLELSVSTPAGLVSSGSAGAGADAAGAAGGTGTGPAVAVEVHARVLDRAMVSDAPITHATYFAAGHHALVGVQSRDSTLGATAPGAAPVTGAARLELAGFALPRLGRAAFRVPIAQVAESAAELMDEGRAGFGDEYTSAPTGARHGSGGYGSRSGSSVGLTDGPNGPSLPPLTALSADNIQLRVYVGLGEALVQMAFVSLPLITEATFFNTEDDNQPSHGGGGSPSPRPGGVGTKFGSTLQADDLIATSAQRRRLSSMMPGGGGTKSGGGAGGYLNDGGESLELTVVSAFSMRTAQASEDEDGGTDDDDDEYDDGRTGGRGNADSGSPPPAPPRKDAMDVTSVCGVTSPFTFKGYALVGCADASVRCISALDAADEVFYYLSDIATRGTRASMAVAAVAPSRDAQLAVATCADGTVSVLSIDRRLLLSEHRLLTGRSGAAAASSGGGAGSDAAASASGSGGFSSRRSTGASAAAAAATGGSSARLSAAMAAQDPANTRGSTSLHVPAGSTSTSAAAAAASTLAPSLSSGAGATAASSVSSPMAPRKLYCGGDLDQALYAIATGNEWSLVRASDLVRWLNDNDTKRQDYTVM